MYHGNHAEKQHQPTTRRKEKEAVRRGSLHILVIFIVYLHVIGDPSESMSPLRACYEPVAQTEVED